ncbi:MAG: hypothetical protein A2032_07385 [Chloroflexi bacterium RBG_19FT_COMBO_49_13]|nr:MAG: hypothetical protein A2032_07385 [Chloroflexi bacterium RBG_19FT_COMBO_49_13]
METENIPILQLPLFVYGESVTNIVELFPALWKATESLTSPETITRQRGIDALLELGAQRVSPLIAYMIAICLSDPDIYIRRRVAFILADLITSDSNGRRPPEEVRSVVNNYLHQMREATVFGLIEVAIADQQAEKSIYHIFNACPYVGKYLGDILTEWKNPLPIRQKAIYFIGLVGYMDALPVLERLFNRLEARKNGQYVMAFAPPSIKSDDELLSSLRVAIKQLSAR